MTKRAVTAVLVAALSTGVAGPRASALQGQRADGVGAFLLRVQSALQAGGAAAYERFLTDSADRERAAAFADTEVPPGATRVVIKERDRDALPGTLPGSGYRLIVDAFEEFGLRARVATWEVDIKQVGDAGSDNEWLIADEQRLSAVEDVYALTLDPARQFAVHGLTVSDEDLDLVLAEGSVFVADTDQGTTAVVFVGRGEMKFHPAPDAEKGQLKIFSGAESMDTGFDVATLRINPADFDRLLAREQLVATAVDPRDFRRAERVFGEDSPKSYGLDLGDLSKDTWSLVPKPGDLVADIHTRRFDTLTYARAGAQAEDISLLGRDRRKTVALYASEERRDRPASWTRREALGEYEVTRYEIDISATPDRQWIEGRARMKVRVRADALSSLTLRLAEPLAVRSVSSDEFGRLFSMRVRAQGSLVVNLPATLLEGTEFTLTVDYAGRVEPDTLDTETIALQRPPPPPSPVDAADPMAPEPSYLYSGRSSWYPQPLQGGYATATLRITVPAPFGCVASGEQDAASPTVVAATNASPARALYVFNAERPVRYLAFILSRFVVARNAAIDVPTGRPEAGGTDPRALNVTVAANPRQVSHSREVGNRAGDIARFYRSLLGDFPYPSFTIALAEHETPGGHSPGYFAVLNQPLAFATAASRRDPAIFDGDPDFILAHEVAHQWWGQAVGWHSYHDQWLSEGLSQYFAARYAKHARGGEVFATLMRQMHGWAMDQSGEGPISLGYRLGHIRGDSRVFRAIVYDKSALVLHMLGQFIGDEALLRGFRRFYGGSRFRNVGTADFKAAMEAEAGRPLTRFFDRWIDGATLPRLAFTYRIDAAEVVLHVEQFGELFDLPVAVTLHYADRTSAEVVVPVTDRTAELRVPLAGALRTAEISRIDVPLAEIVKN